MLTVLLIQLLCSYLIIVNRITFHFAIPLYQLLVELVINVRMDIERIELVFRVLVLLYLLVKTAPFGMMPVVPMLVNNVSRTSLYMQMELELIRHMFVQTTMSIRLVTVRLKTPRLLDLILQLLIMFRLTNLNNHAYSALQDSFLSKFNMPV